MQGSSEFDVYCHLKYNIVGLRLLLSVDRHDFDCLCFVDDYSMFFQELDSKCACDPIVICVATSQEGLSCPSLALLEANSKDLIVVRLAYSHREFGEPRLNNAQR